MEDKVRGRDIIAQVVENMRSQGEELRYSTIVPAAYDVYLHPADFQRLENLAGLIADQARRALGEELERLNRASPIEARVRGALHRPRAPRERAGSAWEIRLIADPNDELEPGDILVDSTLITPESESLSGSRTRRILTTRRGDRVESREAPAIDPAPLASLGGPTAVGGTAPVAVPAPPGAIAPAGSEVDGSSPAVPPGVLATLLYRDEN